MRRCAQARLRFAALIWVELDSFLCLSFLRVVAGGVLISRVAVTAAAFIEPSISSCTWKWCEFESQQ